MENDTVSLDKQQQRFGSFVSYISLYTKLLVIFSCFIIATIGLHYLDGLQSTALAIDHQV
jgi:hypothetical protein